MGTITVKGKTIEVDEDGFLANLDDWSMDVGRTWPRFSFKNWPA